MSGVLLAAMPGGPIYSLVNLPNPIQDTGAPTTTYQVTLRFQVDGACDVLRTIGSDSLDVETFVVPLSKVAGLHVRCNKISGDSLTAGDAESAWHALTSERTFIMQYTSSGGSDFITGSFDIELSDDAGTTVVQTVTRPISAGEIL